MAFQHHSSMSISDIMNILDCNRQSAYNYLNRFEDAGYRLTKETQQKKTYYTYKPSHSNVATDVSYVPITGKSLYKYTNMSL